MQYKILDGDPTLWSIGADLTDNGGDELSTYPYRGTDWQLFPAEDPRLERLLQQPLTYPGRKNKNDGHNK